MNDKEQEQKIDQQQKQDQQPKNEEEQKNKEVNKNGEEQKKEQGEVQKKDENNKDQQGEKRKAKKAEKLPKREIQYDGFTLYAYSGNEFPEHMSWISQFCRKEENKWYSKIRHDFATDSFYYYGFGNYIPNLALAKEMICDTHGVFWDYLPDEDIKAIHDQAKQLYGLIHSKWICTRFGLNEMRKKIRDRRYGSCPRIMCKKNPLMPVGLTLIPNRHSAKLFCSCCSDIYDPPKSRRIDGAHFGTAFPACLMVTIPDFDNRQFLKPYDFKAFGFEIYSKNQFHGVHDSNKYQKELTNMPVEAEEEKTHHKYKKHQNK